MAKDYPGTCDVISIRYMVSVLWHLENIVFESFSTLVKNKYQKYVQPTYFGLLIYGPHALYASKKYTLQI